MTPMDYIPPPSSRRSAPPSLRLGEIFDAAVDFAGDLFFIGVPTAIIGAAAGGFIGAAVSFNCAAVLATVGAGAGGLVGLGIALREVSHRPGHW